MKNNSIYRIITVLAVLYCTADSAFALSSIPSTYKPVIIKFILVMGGIFAFTMLMYIGLSIYNRFFVPKDLSDKTLKKYSLRTPVDKDEAIFSYITKNELR